MKRIICILTFTIVCLISRDARSATKPVTLALEDWTTLHVGEVAVLHIPSDISLDRGYVLNGNCREVLALVKRSGRDLTFRTVRPGPGIIMFQPNVPEGHCISCVTVRSFVTALPRK